MENVKAESRIIYLDVLRIVAIFAMMLLHVAALNWYDLPVDSFQWQVLNVYYSLVRFCVPVLLMISGSQLLNPDKSFSMKKLFTRNILRIVTAFAFWSFAYAFAYQIWKYGTITPNTLGIFLKALIVGHYHMWFIYTLVGLYLVVPFLRKLAENKELLEYFMILALIFTFGVNLVQLVAETSSLFQTVLTKLSFFMTLGYSGYFVLGYYLVRFDLSSTLRRVIYGLGVGSILITIAGNAFLSYQQGTPVGSLNGYLLPNTLFASASVFLFFKVTVAKIAFSIPLQQRIQQLSKLTFGMYLVHDFINILFWGFLDLTSLSFNPIVSVPVITSLVFGLSFVVTWILSKIPLVNRYLI